MTEKKFSIQSDSAELKGMRDEIGKFLTNAGFSGKTYDDILVALGEACTNCMRHSYAGEPGRKIDLNLIDEKEKVVFKIRDYGKKIDLLKLKPPVLPPVEPHGLGIYFMQTIMDSVEYNTHHSEGNEIILTKYKEKRSV